MGWIIVPGVVCSSSCLALGWLSDPASLRKASLAPQCPQELEGSYQSVRADLSLLVGGVLYSRFLSVVPPAVFISQERPQGPALMLCWCERKWGTVCVVLLSWSHTDTDGWYLLHLFLAQIIICHRNSELYKPSKSSLRRMAYFNISPAVH